MGDGAEGLVDAEARIQDRLDDIEQRRTARPRVVKDPEAQRELESLKLARKELDRQAGLATHPVRQQQLLAALSELDRRIVLVSARLA